MTKRYNSHHIKKLFLILILLIAVFSCKRDKKTERNDTESGIPALGASDNYQEQEQEQGQYDDEDDFEVKIIEGTFRDSVIIESYKGNKEIVRIPPLIDSYYVLTIGEKAFSNKKMTDVIIPDSVYTIEEGAFENCGLTSVTFGKNVKEIGDSAFENNNLAEVTIPGVYYISFNTFKNNNLTGVTISDGVRRIYKGAFENNQLTKVTVPDSVDYIGESAFENNKLAEVNLSNKIDEIGERAFKKNKLNTITIPDSLTRIRDDAFDDNPLTKIIVESKFYQTRYAFSDGFFNFLRSNWVNHGTYTYDGKSWSFVKSEYADPKDFKIRIKKGKYGDDYYDKNIAVITDYEGENTNVVIPSRIKGLPVIGISSEIANMKIISVTIPDSVIYIEESAFYGEGYWEKPRLESVIFGNNVKTIGEYSFYSNKITGDVVIPDSVVNIGKMAFAGNKITNVIIGKNVAVIGEGAFWGPVKSITIPRDLNLRNEAFSNDFEKFYNDNGKKEGTYLWDGKNWKMKK